MLNSCRPVGAFQMYHNTIPLFRTFDVDIESLKNHAIFRTINNQLQNYLPHKVAVFVLDNNTPAQWGLLCQHLQTN